MRIQFQDAPREPPGLALKVQRPGVLEDENPALPDIQDIQRTSERSENGVHLCGDALASHWRVDPD
jgi:hypothetical protein